MFELGREERMQLSLFRSERASAGKTMAQGSLEASVGNTDWERRVGPGGHSCPYCHEAG